MLNESACRFIDLQRARLDSFAAPSASALAGHFAYSNPQIPNESMGFRFVHLFEMSFDALRLDHTGCFERLERTIHRISKLPCLFLAFSCKTSSFDVRPGLRRI